MRLGARSARPAAARPGRARFRHEIVRQSRGEGRCPHRIGGRAVWATYHPSAAIRFGPNGAPRAGLVADLAAVAASLGAVA